VNSESNPAFPQIIIRQEVILPYPYPGVQVNGTIPPCPPMPCPPRGPAPAPAGPGSYGYGVSHYISVPSSVPCSGTTYPGLTSDQKIKVCGHSDDGLNGPIELQAKCFSADQGNHPTPDSTWVDSKAASGQYLKEDWTLYVPPATLTACNWLYVVASFASTSVTACCTFPLNSSGSGSGSSLVGLPTSATELPPPLAFSVEVPHDAQCPAAGSVIRMQYDNFCSTADQPIWKSVAGTRQGEWMLKCCRYGERRIGMLVLRQPGEGDRTWLSDQFMLDRENLLVHESHRSAAVRVTPE
jgi:hypothetical protein